ncbi:MAG: alpha-ketoglutarate-dependent dioxygenase AlkB [Oligoflexia bacterium]|nr:alpha-ketoglutarate-dependent dioxygenase AlkB [Oligoflexia bacterium]
MSIFVDHPNAQTIIPNQVVYIPDYFSNACEFKDLLASEITWSQGRVKIFGKEHATPRLQSWVADEGITYKYSGKTNHPLPWTATLEKLRNQLNKSFNLELNSALCNWYRNGEDSNGWHSDNEPELGQNPTILSLSFGATRKFQLKNRETGELINLSLEEGSLLIMFGESQKQWKHQIPKQRRVLDDRVNITLRKTFKKISKSQS